MDQERQLKEEIEKVSGGEGEPTPRMNKLPTKVLLILLSVCGTVLCAWNLIRTFQAPLTLLGVLSSTIQFLAYLAMLIYVLYTNKIKGTAPFQGVVLAFAALLGIQLLQSGQAITGYGLSENLTLMINTFNVIAFANAIMFSCKLDKKKTAVGYLTMAVILKLIGELILIIKLWTYINFGIILISLSVPVLGIVILLAYLTIYHKKD